MKKIVISKISGNKYDINSEKQRKMFYNEIKSYGLTLEDYCEKYFLNVANNKHFRELKENERYFYKDICLTKNEYKKIIVQNKFKCEICENFYASGISGFLSHIKRIHKYKKIEDYLNDMNFQELKSDSKKCGFCGRQAKYYIEYDIEKRIYQKIFPRYLCDNLECRNEICLKFFNKSYSEAKNEYEHIGAKTEFLKIIYQTDEKGLVEIGKSKIPKNRSQWKCNKENFISKYGQIEGEKKYYQRCKNVGFGGTLSGFISKYGQIEGEKKYLQKVKSHANHLRAKTIKKATGEYKLYKKLSKIINIELEYPTIYGTVDMYVKSKNVIIEFYGDYWHCNPAIYPHDFYNKTLKMTLKEKKEFDEKRMRNIQNVLKSNKLIIVWENSFNNMNKEILINQMMEFINNDIKGTLWI